MIFYRANRDNKPFYSRGDVKTKPEWLVELNLTEEEFDILSASDFDIEDTELVVSKNVTAEGDCKSFTIAPKTGTISREIASQLEDALNNVLKAFNK